MHSIINPAYATEHCTDSLLSSSFSGYASIAANNKYLIVGYPWLNKIVVYTQNRDGKWLQIRKISPPRDSTAYRIGSGFGHTIVLDGDSLIIGTFTVINTEKNDVVNPQDFQENNGLVPTATALYQTSLDKKTDVKRIDLSDIPTTKGTIIGIAADNGKIGFILSQVQRSGKRINQIYVLSNGKSHALPDGKLEYKIPSKVWSASIYGSDIAIKNNLFLASVDRDKDRGGVWLFDLNSLQSKPQKQTIPFATPAIVSVAISDRFMAIGNSLTSFYRYSSKASQKTLIRNIVTGSTKIIDGVGSFSLDGDILARTRSISNNRDAPRVLEVFRIDDDATPYLIKKHSDVGRVLLQNRLLITIQKSGPGKKICTERMR